ncbi:RING-H2 finger protein ATL57 [Humulus lupulus]|uniref:RING-H2 finger protein ATL57 n=1 Tax=Humulus lupulus TaxID=3486 RepID=UPI002B40AD58|nr:RING-H2 finger protein ATL57 [Humulus lupulus]
MESPSPSPVPPPNASLDSENGIRILLVRWFPLALLVAVVLLVFADDSDRTSRRSNNRRRSRRTSNIHLPPSGAVAPFPPPAKEKDNVVSITCMYRVEKSESPITGGDNNDSINNDDGGFDCAICLEDFNYGDECKMFVHCNHGFHKVCIDKWLSRDKHCPLCRGFIRTTGRDTNLDLV